LSVAAVEENGRQLSQSLRRKNSSVRIDIHQHKFSLKAASLNEDEVFSMGKRVIMASSKLNPNPPPSREGNNPVLWFVAIVILLTLIWWFLSGTRP
jgi:hypothetical protein